MIKKIAWDTFKNTGDINAFLEFKQIENIENSLNINKSKEMEKALLVSIPLKLCGHKMKRII